MQRSYSNRPGSVTRNLRLRFWAEAVLGGLSCLLLLLTLVWRDWIEAVSGWDPDHHNGSVEWFIVAVLGVITVSLFLMARVEWRWAAVVPAEADA